MADPDDESIREIASDYQAKEAAKRVAARDAQLRRQREHEDHGREVMQDNAAVRELAARFLQWARRNNVKPNYHRAGWFGFFKGWVICSGASYSGDPNSYQGEHATNYQLRLSPSGRLHVVKGEQPYFRKAGSEPIWRRVRRSELGFGVDGVRAEIGTIVGKSGKQWP